MYSYRHNITMELISEAVCTRCEKDVTISNYSWFTDDIICHACMKIEGEILSQADEDKEELEDVGEVPEDVIDGEINWGEYPSSSEEQPECSD